MADKSYVDLLNRDGFISNTIMLIDTLSKGKKNASFAINGKWGVGKSYILDRLEEQLEDKYLVFRYNAWENDFYEEPLIAILSSFDEQLNEFNSIENTVKGTLKSVIQNVKKAIFGLIGKVTKAKLGFDVIEATNEIKDAKKKQEIDVKFDEKATINAVRKEVRENLEKLSEEITVIVMVDELDRCLPEFSIKTLERLHHLFNGVSNLQVIIATDKEQLENTVHTIFGNDTDTKNYLKKFIDFEISLDEGEVNNRFKNKYKEYCDMFECRLNITKDEDVEEFYSNIFNGIDARTQALIVQKAQTIHSMICEEGSKYDYAYQCIGLSLVVAMHLNCLDILLNGEEIKTITKMFVWNDKHFEFIKSKMFIRKSQEYGGANSVYLIGVASLWDIVGSTIFRLYQRDIYSINRDWVWESTNAFNISQQMLDGIANYAETFMGWLKIID